MTMDHNYITINNFVYLLIFTFLCSADRESIIARQEFIQQLSLWDELPTEKQVPIPGSYQYCRQLNNLVSA